MLVVVGCCVLLFVVVCCCLLFIVVCCLLLLFLLLFFVNFKTNSTNIDFSKYRLCYKLARVRCVGKAKEVSKQLRASNFGCPL